MRLLTRSQASSSERDENGAAKKPWAMLKDASLKTKDPSSSTPLEVSPVARTTTKTTTQTSSAVVQKKRSFSRGIGSLRHNSPKMYASIDDLSPEYCGLPFVKKLKILNERQKLAELERVVRSSSLDCGDSGEFDQNLTRSHSEAVAIEYARKLKQYNKVRIFLA